jgi:plastocyanin
MSLDALSCSSSFEWSVAPTAHPPGPLERRIVVTLRWTFRAAACVLLLALAACSGATAAQPARPNEVQVIEPAGREAAWTYAPQELRVSAGTTVKFVNMGKEFHTVTSSDEGRPFDVGIDSGKSATVTFDKVGVYAYHCGVHPQMTGVVRVCDGACS